MAPDLGHENRAIVDCLCAALGEVIATYRFGSTVYGTASSTSDIDIAVLVRTRISAATWFELQDRLSMTLGREVDLLDLSMASPVLAMQVIATGQLLYEGDGSLRGGFEDSAFGAYARLNEERRGILERIAEEGTVYGR